MEKRKIGATSSLEEMSLDNRKELESYLPSAFNLFARTFFIVGVVLVALFFRQVQMWFVVTPVPFYLVPSGLLSLLVVEYWKSQGEKESLQGCVLADLKMGKLQKYTVTPKI